MNGKLCETSFFSIVEKDFHFELALSSCVLFIKNRNIDKIYSISSFFLDDCCSCAVLKFFGS